MDKRLPNFRHDRKGKTMYAKQSKFEGLWFVSAQKREEALKKRCKGPKVAFPYLNEFTNY